MELWIILVVLAILFLVLKIALNINIKEIKKLGDNKKLDELVNKYPENIEICEEILKKLNNKDVKIQEDKEAKTTMYLVLNNKILISNLKNSYTRIQTIAHECLHSIQDKRILWSNFIISNIFLIYFLIISILAIIKILPMESMFLGILILIGFSVYVIRAYLENEAMIKAKYLAKEYMEDKEISTKKEIEDIISQYNRLNDLGIKCVNYQLYTSILIKCVIFIIICLIF